MKRNVLTIMIGLLLLSLAAMAEIPQSISYQGVLSNTEGKLVADGYYTITLRLYEGLHATEPLYTETQKVTVVKGLFNVFIGSVVPLPSTLTFDRAYFLGVSVNGAAEMQPRTALTTSPYAFRAQSAALADVAKSLSPDASGAVTSLNNINGHLVLQGGGATKVSTEGNVITISTDESTLSSGTSKGNSLMTTPSGPAGGDLMGTYPNPMIGNSKVTNAKLAYASVGTGNIMDGSVTLGKISTTGASNGKTVMYNGSSVVWGSPNASGPAGGDLTGNYPNPTIAAGAVTSTKIADGSIVNADVNSSAAIAYSKLALTNSIVASDLTNSAVTTTKYADSSLTGVKLATAAVNTAHIADGAVTDDKIAFGISYRKLSGVPTSLPPDGPAGGDLTGNYPNPNIAANAVNSSTIADGSIDNADVSATAAIAYSKLALTNSIASSDISNAAITTATLANGAVTDAKVANGISYAKLTGTPTALPPSGAAGGDLTGNYPNPVIATNAVTNSTIANGAVTDAKVANGISYTKLTGVPTSLPPSGAAGGDLTGNYPNPVIATNAVTNSTIANGAVTDAKVANGISYTKLTGVPTSLPPSGAAGGDLTGNYPNPVIGSNAVTSSTIADSAVTDAKIANGISYAKLTGTPTSLPPSGAAGGDLTGNYPNPVIANNAVTNSTIANGAVTDAKVANGISYAKLTGAPTSLPPSGAAGGDLTGSYPNPIIGDSAITSAKLHPMGATSGQVLKWNGTSWQPSNDSIIGLIYFSESRSTVAPNNNIPAHQLTTIGAETDIDLVLQPKGSGALQTQLADGGVAGGNKRGVYATDLQRIRTSGVQVASGAYSVISGGENNAAADDYTTVSGGWQNTIAGRYSVISGGRENTVDGNSNVVAGGWRNVAKGEFNVISGGRFNRVGDSLTYYAVVAGGLNNSAPMQASTVSGGAANLASALGATVSGGAANKANGSFTTILGGVGLTLNGESSVGYLANDVFNTKRMVVNDSNTAVLGNVNLWLASNDGTPRSLRFYEQYSTIGDFPNGTNYVAFKAANSVAADVTWTLPNADGTAGQVLSTDGSGSLSWSTITFSGAAGGDLTGNYPNPAIANDAVTSAKIADSTITNADISATAAIGYSKLALTNSITTSDISDAALITSKYADSSVTDAKIANGISYTKLSGAPASLPPSGAAGGDLTGNYPNPTIADSAITSAKLHPMGATSGQVLKWNGTSWQPSSDNTASVYFSESRNTALPNDSIPAHQFRVTGAETNIDVVLSPKGAGAVQTHIADGSAAGGGKRGAYATDLQRARVSDTQVASGAYSVISGGENNIATDSYTTISGGVNNQVTGSYSVVSGGRENAVTGNSSVVAGGWGNAAYNQFNTISGGRFNIAGNVPDGVSCYYAVVGGGYSNTANGQSSVISGGAENTVSGLASVISGGLTNNASGNLTTIMGGSGLTLNGARSLGYNANTASSDRDMVISDANTAVLGNVNLWLASNDGTPRSLRFYEQYSTAGDFPNGTNYVGFKAAHSVAADVTWTLPNADGTAGQVLSTNGSATLAWSTITASGAAGGDLTGNYPNPTIGNGAVTSAKIADSAITNADISASAAIGYSKLNLSSSIQGSDIATGTFTSTNAHHAIGNDDNNARELRLLEPSSSGANYSAFKAQAQATDISYTLPAAAPASNGQVLSSTTSGVMSWATPANPITAVVMATKTAAQSLNPSGNGGPPEIADLTFETASVTPPSGVGTWTNNSTFTVGTSGAGLYLVTASVGNTNTAAVSMQLLVNGAVVSFGSSNESANFSPENALGRGNLSMVLSLSTGDVVKLQVLSSNSLSGIDCTTDGTTRVVITKMN